MAGIAAPARRIVEVFEYHFFHVRPGRPGSVKETVKERLGVPVPVRAPGDPKDRDGHGPAPAARRTLSSATTAFPSFSASTLAVG